MNKNNNIKHSSLFLIVISFALGMRQLAMTMVMPFISVYGESLKHSTPLLAGIALGVFGLMQAIFQIPYGIWSDKKGNKIVMVVGIMQVILGLILAYFATSIYTLIIARALQGSGAIIAVGYSWISSNSSTSKERLNSLSIVSMVVSSAAACSFAIGPLLHKYISVKNMFLYSALLIFLAWIIICLFLKDNKKSYVEPNNINTKALVTILIKDRTFMTLNLGMFINNFVMTGIFFAVPQYLKNLTGLDGMWKIFLPSTLVGILIMKIIIKSLELSKTIPFLVTSFLLGGISSLFYLNKTSFVLLLIGTSLFMTSYISIATLIPSLGNSLLKDDYRGAGNGIMNSLQYIGSFLGSVVISEIFSLNESLAFIVLLAISLIGGVTTKIYVIKERFYEKQDTSGSC